MSKKIDLIRDAIKEYRYSFSKLKQLIKTGEISNKTNLNGPIFLERTELYGDLVCTYLELSRERIEDIEDTANFFKEKDGKRPTL